jgi:Beta-lactamase
LGAVDQTHFPPGSDISYSNTGYVAVAAALSRAAGRSFAQLMRALVFAPLGMAETVLHDTIGLVVPGMAFSYDVDPVGHLRREMPEEQVGDGAVLSHLEDLAGWHGFLVDGRVLGADVRRQLVQPAVLDDGWPTRYAAGVARYSFAGHDLLAHAGSMHAYRSSLLSVPAQGLGVTVLCNRGGTDAQTLGLEVLRDCLRHVPGRRLPRTEPPGLPEGRWVCPATGEILRSATRADGGLSLDPGEGLVGLSWDRSEAWRTTDGRWWARRGPAGELHVEDDLGRRKRFLLVADDPPHDVAVPAGRYHGATLGTVEVRCQGNTSRIAVGRRPPAVLVPSAAYGGAWFFRAAVPQPVWVRWHPGDDSLTVSTGGAAHRLTPRRPASGDGPVSRPGGGPAAPPIPR